VHAAGQQRFRKRNDLIGFLRANDRDNAGIGQQLDDFSF